MAFVSLPLTLILYHRGQKKSTKIVRHVAQIREEIFLYFCITFLLTNCERGGIIKIPVCAGANRRAQFYNFQKYSFKRN